MDNLDKFKEYFNRDFWRGFQGKRVFSDIPSAVKDKELIVSVLHNDLVNKTYYPRKPSTYIHRNKGAGITRVIPVFTIQDYCVYYYCIKKLEPKIAYNRIDNTFGGWSLNGLIRRSEEDEMGKRVKDYDELEDAMAELHGISVSEHSFNPKAWVKAYGELNSRLYATAKESEYSYVAEFDIANYYDSIRLDKLEASVREIATKEERDVVSLLFHFLNYWNRDINEYNRQTVGLPQDALGDCSRILANYYLQSYDKCVFDICKSNKCRYLRYADDQFIFADKREQLDYMLFKVSKQINCLGLSINQKKVKVLTTAELINKRCFDIFSLLKSDDDKNNTANVEKFTDYYLKIASEGKLNEVLNNGTSMLNRLLGCNALAGINNAKKKELIDIYFSEEYLENAKAYYLSRIYRLLNQEEKQVYLDRLAYLAGRFVHNAFHFEVLSFFEEIKADCRLIKRRLEELRLE